jgi:hypothetical protein
MRGSSYDGDAESSQSRLNDIPSEAEFRQYPDRQIGGIELPPLMAVAGRTLIGVMIVVPAFAMSEVTDKQVVAAILVCCVAAVAPHVGEGIDRPSLMPDKHGANDDAPDHDA